MILQAFKFGTFSKIPEFIEFKRNLQLSIQKAVTHRRMKRLELIQAVSWKDFVERVKKIDLSDLSLDGGCPILHVPSLHDNRDTSLIVRYKEDSLDFFSALRGACFPLEKTNYWIEIHSFIPLIYNQLLSDSVPQYSVSLEDISIFLKSKTPVWIYFKQ